MEPSETGNRSAILQAIKRRDDAMRDTLGMGSVGTEVDKRHKPQVGIWRVAGNSDRSRAGWPDTVGDQRREGGPETHSDRGFRYVAVPVVVPG